MAAANARLPPACGRARCRSKAASCAIQQPLADVVAELQFLSACLLQAVPCVFLCLCLVWDHCFAGRAIKISHLTEHRQVRQRHCSATDMLANQGAEAVLLLRSSLAPYRRAIQELGLLPDHKLHWLHYALTAAIARMPNLSYPQTQMLVQGVLVEPVQLHVGAGRVSVQNGTRRNERSSPETKVIPSLHHMTMPFDKAGPLDLRLFVSRRDCVAKRDSTSSSRPPTCRIRFARAIHHETSLRAFRVISDTCSQMISSFSMPGCLQ